MTIALDLGSRHFRSLRRQGGRLIGRRNLAEYVALPDTPGHRKLLERTSYPFACCEGSLLIVGQAALELAETLQLPSVPLLLSNQLPVDDPLVRQVVASLIDCLIPRAENAGEPCWMTVPGALHDPETVEDRKFFCQLVRLKGYEPRVVSSGRCVILAELGAEGFTGVGLDIGAGATRASVAHHGREIARTHVPRGGRWIDKRLAESEDRLLWDAQGNRFLDLTGITRWKESKLVSVLNPISEREQRLALLYEELLGDMLAQFRVELAQQASLKMLPQPLSLVCTGGVTLVPGFSGLMEEVLQDTLFPIPISDVRCAHATDYTVARGTLILAELEETVANQALVA
ncbi:MAG: cell division FtsA domain-containing protein [Planctomycetaceae bacterium]|nr:cell division FtsA domain-containing protein [Planctomycetaceae bacterium]